MLTDEIAVLVSLGRHPASGRKRRAAADARALALALSLSKATVNVIHAGDVAEPALRDYLGMGVERLTVLSLSAQDDPTRALADHLGKRRPRLILAGTTAESGEDSGFLPYLLAEALGYCLAPGIVDVALFEDRAELRQTLPRGRQRVLAAPLPLVVTIDRSAPAPRLSAYGPAKRGQIVKVDAEGAPDEDRNAWQVRPARPPLRRLAAAKGGSAAERVAAATEAKKGRGQIIVDPQPVVTARAIYDYLVNEELLRLDQESP